MYLGYNTNGLAHHDLEDAVELLGEIGYRGVAVTIDHHALSPRDPHVGKRLDSLRSRLERLRMRSVIETGARFLLDPRRKHEPTLLSRDAGPRIAFYKHAIRCAEALGSDCVSIWSGALRDPISDEDAMARLARGLAEVLDFAAARRVVIAFEPEPGMWIDGMAAFDRLLSRIDAPSLRLTLDVGHLQCQGETPIPEVIRRWAPRLANVHLEDMRRGVHEHLMFGEGEIDFPPVLQTLAEVGYTGGLYVELSRHSHDGPEAARTALARLGAVWTEREH